MATVPKALSDRLNAALDAKADVESAVIVKAEKDAAASMAQGAKEAQDAELLRLTDVLSARRKELEELEEVFLVPGGTVETSEPPAPATATPR